MQATDPKPKRVARARLWPAIIIGLLSLHALAMGSVVFIATRDPSFAVEPEAYKKAVAWDRSRAQAKGSERLGWTATIRTADSPDAFGRRLVTCRIVDAQSVTVRAATVRLEVFSHARAAERVTAHLEPSTDGSYFANVPMSRSGTWEFRIAAERGDEHFRSVIIQSVGDRT